MASEEYPTSVSGGCLCGSVRYTITLPPSHDWKRGCRKNGGSLVAWLHNFPASSVAFTSQTTLSRYHATPRAARGFCSNCGSWLFWRREDSDSISMAVGTVDKDALEKWGKQLAYSEVHLWSEDAVEGITDHLPGEKWRHNNEGEGAERIG
ncbi:hypothetical protein ACHAPU_000401 [Fusarium lateritium]